MAAETPYRCASEPAAPAGESEVGETPFYDGFVALLDRLADLIGAAGLARGVGAVVGVLLTPLAWFTGLTVFIAAGLTWGLQLAFPVAQAIARVPLAPDPVVLASVLLLLALRLGSLPMLRRSARARARRDLIAPQIEALKRKHKGDRERLNHDMMVLYKRSNANPMSGCLPVAFVVTVLAGVWELLRGLTVRSEVGTFAPRFADPDSALFEHLYDLEVFSTWNMNMTVALPQVGGCALLLPYGCVFGLLLALQAPAFAPMWRPGWRSGVGIAAAGVALTLVILPSFFLVLKVADSLFVLFQSWLLRRTRKQEAKRLRSDPVFLQTVGETMLGLIPPAQAPPGGATEPPDVTGWPQR